MLLKTVTILCCLMIKCINGEDNCDDWDIQFKNKCFSFMKENQMGWSDAEKQCEQKGGLLASIHSPDEANAIGELSSEKVYGWLGLHKRDGVLEWSDGSEVDFEKWSDEQYFIGDDNFCVLLGGDGLWYKDDCYVRDNYICEKIIVDKDVQQCAWYLEDSCDDHTSSIVNESERYDPADCQNLCSGFYSEFCESFMYNLQDHTCLILSSKTQQGCQLQGGPNNPPQEYCSVYHPECHGMFHTSCQIDENTLLNSTSNVLDAKSCQRMCKEDQDDCRYWLYDNSKECKLYSDNQVKHCQVLTGLKNPPVLHCVIH